MDECILHDPARTCPCCATNGHLSFVDVPKSRREYETNGELYVTHLLPSRDYECRNCGAAFTLTDWEDA